MHFRKIGIRSGIHFQKIGITSGMIHFRKIGMRNGHVFEASMARPRPKSGQVPPAPPWERAWIWIVLSPLTFALREERLFLPRVGVQKQDGRKIWKLSPFLQQAGCG